MSDNKDKKYFYLVALKTGGLMEDPQIHYQDFQIIYASTEQEALQIYNTKNNCSYFYGEVIGILDDYEDINEYSHNISDKFIYEMIGNIRDLTKERDELMELITALQHTLFRNWYTKCCSRVGETKEIFAKIIMDINSKKDTTINKLDESDMKYPYLLVNEEAILNMKYFEPWYVKVVRGK